MAKLIAAGISALVLGLCSTAIYAGETDSKRPPKGCGVECHDKIDIELKVEPHCDIKVLTPKLVLKDRSGGDSETGYFKVGANATYKLDLSTANGGKLKYGSNEIPVTFVTKRGGTTIPMGVSTGHPATGGGWASYSVKASIDEVGVSYPVGTYTEQYKIKVYF